MDELIWIEVETTKSSDTVWLFKGKILQAVFEAIVTNKLKSGYFKLDNVYWTSTTYDDYGNAKGKKINQYGKEKWDAYEGSIYLKIEHLVSISPFDGEKDLAKFAEKKNPLSVVRPIRS